MADLKMRGRQRLLFDAWEFELGDHQPQFDKLLRRVVSDAFRNTLEHSPLWSFVDFLGRKVHVLAPFGPEYGDACFTCDLDLAFQEQLEDDDPNHNNKVVAAARAAVDRLEQRAKTLNKASEARRIEQQRRRDELAAADAAEDQRILESMRAWAAEHGKWPERLYFVSDSLDRMKYFYPDGRRLDLTASDEGRIKAWIAEDREKRADLFLLATGRTIPDEG